MRNLLRNLILVAGTLPPLPGAPRDEPRGARHWAFQGLSQPIPPQVCDAGRVRTDVDRFVQAALEARNLTLGPDADRYTLLRRLSFDLTGLPPTPEEISQFVA